MSESLCSFMFYLGVIYFVSHMVRLCHGVWVFYVSKWFVKQDLVKRFGKWAVVTGGSDGLGECYCRELASRGHNIVIISEKLHRLKQVTQQLEQDFKVQTKYIHADLRGGEDLFANIEKQLLDIEIGILINNAGVLVPYPMTVDEMSHDQVMSHVLVNMAAPTHMCRMLVPRMKAQGRGAIVNISSLTTIGGAPYTALYGASKSYMKSLSEAMQYECKDYDIQVQCVMPAFVKTNLLSFSTFLTDFVATEPSVFVRSAVDTIGVASNTKGYFPHQIQYDFINIFSSWFYTHFSGFFMRRNRAAYERQRIINLQKLIN